MRARVFKATSLGVGWRLRYTVRVASAQNALSVGQEDERFLTEQIITYLGNKRALLDFIGGAIAAVQKKLRKTKLDMLDVFSGSGVVSRYMKQHAATLYANDIEPYCKRINACYLMNKSAVDFERLRRFHSQIVNTISQNGFTGGFISELYAPRDDRRIQKGERVFYTTRNALYIDTCRQLLEGIDEPYKTLLLAPLLYEASVHNNTSGVFKGFYKNSKTGVGQYGGDGKNALSRILGDIHLPFPIFSNYECRVSIYQEDANNLKNILPEVDVAYLDPPYNQHPYGSNYFMLNLIDSYKRPSDISKVSGIPTGWNKSPFNKKQQSASAMFDLCSGLNAKFLLVSFNSEGFIKFDEMLKMLSSLGKVSVMKTEYNAFRGSRNLNKRDAHVTEYLYLVEKK